MASLLQYLKKRKHPKSLAQHTDLAQPLNNHHKRLLPPQVAPLTARQLRALGAPETEAATNGTSVQEIPRGYLMGRLGGSTGMKYVDVPRS